MQKFLTQVYQHIIANYPENLSNYCLVLPSRRGAATLKKLFGAEEANPAFYAIEDFIHQMSGLKKVGNITLMLELQDIFQELTPHIDARKIASWLPTLLKDFDKIDQHLIDAAQLFANLANIKRIENWNITEEEITPQVETYLAFWSHLGEAYKLLNERLLEKKEAYNGMMYRHLADHVEDVLLPHPKYEHFIFIGLNALTKVEHKILNTLFKAKKAEALWDSDRFYMQKSTENRAGMFLKDYKEQGFAGEWQWQSDHLLQDEKNIQVISVNNASMQGRVANQIIENWKAEETILGKAASTAIILPDEQLLYSLLYSLDTEKFNITMGVSLRNSPLFNLIQILFELHETTLHDQISPEDYAKTITKFNHRSIFKILNHPFIRTYELSKLSPQQPISLIQDFVQYILRANKVFVAEAEIPKLPEILPKFFQLDDEKKAQTLLAYPLFLPLLNVIFKRWFSVNDVVDCLEKLINILKEAYQPMKHKKKMLRKLEMAYLEIFEEILQELKETLAKKTYKIDIKTFKMLLYELIREEKIPFESDKESLLQVMGMLETRTLDFEKVIILSVNENTLPKGKKQSSLIPLDMAREFGLPTYLEQDAMMSYHFYRLLQRAKNVALLYVPPSDTYGGDEKSRFILQLENDLVKQNPNIHLENFVATIDEEEKSVSQELKIEKNTEILEKIKKKLQEGLSYSHIDTFIQCSLKYYFQQIAEIREAVQVEKELGNNIMGIIIHEVLEDIFGELAAEGKPILATHLLDEVPKITQRVKEKFEKIEYAGYEMTGHNYISQEVANKLLEKFLTQQAEEAAIHPFEIISLESNKNNNSEEEALPKPIMPVIVSVELAGEKIDVKLKGIIDRVDKVGNTIRIIDYKTGKIDAKELKIPKEEVDKLISSKDTSKARQLWIYQYMLLKNMHENTFFPILNATQYPVEAGIYALRNAQEGFLKFEFPLAYSVEEFIQHTETFLKQLILQILDTKEPFQKTEHLDVCQYCDYKNICGR